MYKRQVQDTLSLSDSAVTLAKGGTQGIAAKVIGTEGWSIAAESDQAGVAAANIQNGTITVIAVEPGTATITVTATKADKSPLVKHITVTAVSYTHLDVYKRQGRHCEHKRYSLMETYVLLHIKK